MNTKLLVPSVFGTALLVAAQTASAAVMTTAVETESFSGIPTYNQGSTGQAPLTFSKFDSGLGSLLNVYVKATINVDGGNIYIDNEGASASTGTADWGASLTIGSGDVTLLDGTFSNIGLGVEAVNTFNFNLGADDGDGAGLQTTGSDYDTATGLPASGSDGYKAVNSVFLNQFIGTGGTFNINYTVTQIFETFFSGGVAGAFDPMTSNGSVQIYYEYDAPNTPSVPLPASAALLGLGLIGLRRRLIA